MTSELLLEATGVVKHYGAVAALRDASLAVRPGEVHALMGANGAGKSTLVKILTGVVRPDAGRILIRGQARAVHSPAQARRTGLVSVYQEPALIPDLDVAANLRLTETPVEPFLDWVGELGVPELDLFETARNLPLAVLRILDLARALAIEPEVLLLDEMTAALPADLAEKVLDVVARQRETGRSVIFISHRLLEISALVRPRDGAARRRDGGDREDGARRRGADRRADARLPGRGEPGRTPTRHAETARSGEKTPRLRVRSCAPGPSSTTSRSTCGSARCWVWSR